MCCGRASGRSVSAEVSIPGESYMLASMRCLFSRAACSRERASSEEVMGSRSVWDKAQYASPRSVSDSVPYTEPSAAHFQSPGTPSWLSRWNVPTARGRNRELRLAIVTSVIRTCPVRSTLLGSWPLMRRGSRLPSSAYGPWPPNAGAPSDPPSPRCAAGAFQRLPAAVDEGRSPSSSQASPSKSERVVSLK